MKKLLFLGVFISGLVSISTSWGMSKIEQIDKLKNKIIAAAAEEGINSKKIDNTVKMYNRKKTVTAKLKVLRDFNDDNGLDFTDKLNKFSNPNSSSTYSTYLDYDSTTAQNDSAFTNSNDQGSKNSQGEQPTQTKSVIEGAEYFEENGRQYVRKNGTTILDDGTLTEDHFKTIVMDYDSDEDAEDPRRGKETPSTFAKFLNSPICKLVIVCGIAVAVYSYFANEKSIDETDENSDTTADTHDQSTPQIISA